MNNKSFLLVPDFTGWAYDNISHFIADNFCDEYDFYFDYIHLYLKQGPKNLRHYLRTLRYFLNEKKKRRLMLKSQKLKADNTYDIVFYFGSYMQQVSTHTVRAKKIVKGIYTSSFPPVCVPRNDRNISMHDFVERYIGNADLVVCGDPLTCDMYKSVHPNVCWANACFDENFFKRNQAKKINSGARFVVGWTGNPVRPFKGFDDFVVPAVQIAQTRRPGIELKTRFEGPLSTLPRFYDDVDVLLLASDADCGPSSFMEASLCEVPSISTPIGFPAIVIEDGVNGYFVKKDKLEMAQKIVELYDNRDILLSMSRLIRREFIKKMGTDAMLRLWKNAFSTLE